MADDVDLDGWIDSPICADESGNVDEWAAKDDDEGGDGARQEDPVTQGVSSEAIDECAFRSQSGFRQQVHEWGW